MRELSVREIQERQLVILDDIAAFCEKQHIRYLLIGGALLGAVRSGSLLPWDDDIDLFMPRSDYEEFLRKYPDTDQFRLLSSERVEQYYYPFAKVCDRATVFKENVGPEGMRMLDCLGVGVDVFPVDYLPKSRLVGRAKVLQQRALQALCYKDFRYCNPERLSVPLRAVLDVYKGFKGLKGRCVNEYIAAMSVLWGGTVEGEQIIDTWTYQVYSAEALFPGGSIILEGKEYAAPGNTDVFLTECYGSDYMTPKIASPDGHGVAFAL